MNWIWFIRILPESAVVLADVAVWPDCCAKTAVGATTLVKAVPRVAARKTPRRVRVIISPP